MTVEAKANASILRTDYSSIKLTFKIDGLPFALRTSIDERRHFFYSNKAPWHNARGVI